MCILGLNVNQGQEILLRLRTDDLRGESDPADPVGSDQIQEGWDFDVVDILCLPGLPISPMPNVLLYGCTAVTGFRKYDSIRDTLIHELAHMVRYTLPASLSCAVLVTPCWPCS